jgi:hypothetical protein
MTGLPAAAQEIRLDENNLRRIVGDNPVAAAEVFNRMLVTIWKVLFGLEPSHLNGKGTKRTSPLYNLLMVYSALFVQLLDALRSRRARLCIITFSDSEAFHQNLCNLCFRSLCQS